VPHVVLPDSASVPAASATPADSASRATASVLVQPLPATTPAPDPAATRSRIRLLVGGTDWHWEESDAEEEILLVEGGWFPGLRFEYARLTQNGTFGLSVDAGAGAIEYDGGIQNTLTGEIIPFKTYTHYSQATIDAFYFYPVFKGRVPLDIGVRGGVHHWVRTIDSKKMEDPGEYGYVETWSHFSLQPAVAVEVLFGSSSSFRVEGGMRLGFSSEERITELGTGSVKPLLKPKPKPAIRGNALLKVGHVLLEAEYLGLDFDKSPLWRGVIFQPDSYLDRLDVRVGWEF
jgi:hypothetical protein